MQNRVSEKGGFGGSWVLSFCLSSAEPTAAPNHLQTPVWKPEWEERRNLESGATYLSALFKGLKMWH